MLTRFVILVAGDDLTYYLQAHGACLGLIAHHRADFEIAVCTTRPERFRWLGAAVRLLPLSKPVLEGWRGIHDNFYRAKFCVLKEAAALGPGHLVFLDADVLVRAPLDGLVAALDAGACVLHKNKKEKPLDARRGTDLAFRQFYGRTFAGVALTGSTLVLNSGVVGIPAARRELVDRALRMNDALLDAGVRYFAIEQVAWSATLGADPVHLADGVIDHYWGNKQGYVAHVNRLLTEALVTGWNPAEAARALLATPVRVPLRVWHRWWHPHILRWMKIPPQSP